MSFSKNFVWGAATAAYQIEGAAYEDGKGLSNWDVFSKQKGRIHDGHTGDIACDHYHRYKEDVAMMKKIGLKAYRFSISWPRVMPNGTGVVNKAGLKFYSDLIDELLENDITPYVTLYHWDLPYALHQKGGWLNRDIIDWFSEYAKIVMENFSDRVTHFFTVNEPQCFVGFGYETGRHAPGFKSSPMDTFLIAHNVMCAHGAAVRAMRAAAKQDIKIGYAPTGSMHYPASDKREDIEAARTAFFDLPDVYGEDETWAWNVSWWNDPVYLGRYPEEGLKKYSQYLPDFSREDMKLICQPLDLLAQNMYNGTAIRAGADGKPERVSRDIGFPKTGFNWPITPESLYWAPKFLSERYPHLPIYITENGLSCPDVVSVDGKVHDPNRIDFVTRYLRELKRASEDGVPVAGYFLWSLMDNFEWANGFGERFGLIHVDYKTRKRTFKDSAYWYRDVIKQNGENL